MAKKRIEYDGDNQLIKVYRSFSKPKTLVPNGELQKWTDIVKAGEDDKGRTVKAVRYIFDDEETARYNHQPVAFAGLQTYVETKAGEEPYGDDPNFSVREDFGIDGGE